MKEDILQYIWSVQRFDKKNLCTNEGEPLQIIRQGIWNHDAGPDFLQAQIKIGDMTWFGAVEIHLSSNDWQKHRHQTDNAYDHVILHVVWEQQGTALRSDGSVIPVLELKHRVDAGLLKRYAQLQQTNSKSTLACAKLSPQVDDLYKLSALEKAVVKRLEKRSEAIHQLWIANDKHWQQTAYQWLTRAFGFHVNTDAFLNLSQSVPFKVMLKEKNDLHGLLALMLGQAGFLDEIQHTPLKNAYAYLSRKYALQDKMMEPHQFRKGKYRPSNAPMLRIFQLSSLLHELSDLYHCLLHVASQEEYMHLLEKSQLKVEAFSAFYAKWQPMGRESMQTLIINAVVPFRYAYGLYSADENFCESALHLLEQIAPEKNRYTRLFRQNGFPVKSSLESQGVLELHQFACQKSKCLECPVGIHLMKISE